MNLGKGAAKEEEGVYLIIIITQLYMYILVNQWLLGLPKIIKEKLPKDISTKCNNDLIIISHTWVRKNSNNLKLNILFHSRVRAKDQRMQEGSQGEHGESERERVKYEQHRRTEGARVGEC